MTLSLSEPVEMKEETVFYLKNKLFEGHNYGQLDLNIDAYLANTIGTKFHIYPKMMNLPKIQPFYKPYIQNSPESIQVNFSGMLFWFLQMMWNHEEKWSSTFGACPVLVIVIDQSDFPVFPVFPGCVIVDYGTRHKPTVK